MPAALNRAAHASGRRPKTCKGRNRGMYARRACRELSYGDLGSARAASVACDERGGVIGGWKAPRAMRCGDRFGSGRVKIER
jgi:hypothetical protein